MDSNNNRNGRPINMIVVLCDPRRVQTIALTCRCKRRWTEAVPQELHDSEMICQFECPDCHTLYRLHNKQLSRVGGDYAGREQEFARISTQDKSQYDS